MYKNGSGKAVYQITPDIFEWQALAGRVREGIDQRGKAGRDTAKHREDNMQTAQFIMNLCDLYKPALKHEQQVFYSDFLQNFTENQLDELWTATMESHLLSSAPSIGRLKEYGKNITKVRVVSKEDQRKEAINRLTDEQIFSSELGRLSLKQDWADSYYAYCKESGIPEQSDKMLLWFQKTANIAKQAADTLDPKNMFDAVLLKLRVTRQKNNQYWEEKFAEYKAQPLKITNNYNQFHNEY